MPRSPGPEFRDAAIEARVFEVILYEPEIPPNTGNVMRLCANTGVRLHLIRPLGFGLDAKSVRRAGLDYREMAQMRVHASFGECLAGLGDSRWFAFTTRATLSCDAVVFREGDALVFGPETRGLPEVVIESCLPERRLRIPMLPGSRSLNLSNAVAVAVYAAWRQLGYAGAG